MSEFDLAIIGGGLVGASLAHALADSRLKIAMIDQLPAESLYSPVLDNRGLALAYNTAQILAKLNIWHKLLAQVYPINTVHVSEQGSFGFTKLTADKLNLPALGYVVSASSLGAALIADLPSNISIIRPANIIDLIYKQNNWQLTLNNQQITAKILVAADGTNSILHNKLQIPVASKNFQHSAIVCNVYTSQAENTIAYERFTSDGVLAFLPFGKNKLKCVWTVDNNLVNNLINLSDIDFLNKLQSSIGFRLGRLISIDKPVVFPIKQSQASIIYRNNAVLIGNAANTLHPVAAQGFNLGVRDVVVLANLLKQNADLNNYPALRDKDHTTTQNNTNRLVEIFNSKSLFIKSARRCGLLATQFLPILNTHITAQGVGLWT